MSGSKKAGSLLYAGKVDHGFDTATAKDLQARLKLMIRKTQPYTKRIAHKGIWVEPELLAEIEYRAKSAEGKVRHPRYNDCRQEVAWLGRSSRQPDEAFNLADELLRNPELGRSKNLLRSFAVLRGSRTQTIR